MICKLSGGMSDFYSFLFACFFGLVKRRIIVGAAVAGLSGSQNRMMR